MVVDKEEMMITRKARQIIPYIIAVICSTAFFAFEYSPDVTESYKFAKQNHLEKKKARTIALNALKEYGKGSVEYDNYLKEKIATDKAWKELSKVKENDRVFGFTNLQQFLAEFGWVLGVFIYSLFNLLRSFLARSRDFGSIMLHSTLIIIACFYLFWIFQPFQDLSKFSYYLVSILTGILISFSVYFMSLYRFTDVGRLQNTIKNLFSFMFIEIEEREFIKQDKKEEFKEKRLELAKNALDNE